jgi:hypothetical protein
MTKNKNSHPKGCICELFAYLPYLGVYPNTSDMNELCEIACVANLKINRRKEAK